MNRQISISEAKADLSRLLNVVVFGHTRIILTSRGKPKGGLVSLEDIAIIESNDPSPLRLKALEEAGRLRKKLESKKRRLTSIEDDLTHLREG